MDYFSLRNNLIKKAADFEEPIFGEFELTTQCNLHCDMCYLEGQKKTKDLSTSAWKKIFQDAIDAGLLFALLTGGEIFMRKDFFELYNFLYDRGINITLYTNGTLIDETIVQKLEERVPEHIVITLYGSNEESYRKITKRDHAFSKVNHAIFLLTKYNLPLQVRTLPIKLIYQNLDDMINYVKSKDLILNYFLYIAPRRDHCAHPLSLRLNPSELIDFESRIRQAYNLPFINQHQINTKSTSCLALKSTYFITHQGDMQACALAYTPKRTILNQNLKQVFDALSQELKKCNHAFKCQSCKLLNSCQQCYAKRYLENALDGCSKYLKDHAILKAQARYE